MVLLLISYSHTQRPTFQCYAVIARTWFAWLEYVEYSQSVCVCQVVPKPWVREQTYLSYMCMIGLQSCIFCIFVCLCVYVCVCFVLFFLFFFYISVCIYVIMDLVCELNLMIPLILITKRSGDEIANANFLRRHRTCRGLRLRPLNRLPNFYYN